MEKKTKNIRAKEEFETKFGQERIYFITSPLTSKKVNHPIINERKKKEKIINLCRSNYFLR